MPGENSNCCPVLRPTKAQFSRPFESFVSEYFRKNPEVPMVKVIPPKGYTPRKAEYPTDLKIDTPIEQRVLMHDNKPGYYDCVLLSKSTMTVEEFKMEAERRGVPKQRAGDNALLERPFWSSLTVRPPLYGADTPVSLFDEKLDFGWNLRNLKCLLSKYKVPAIPGVTTPMTYFGMWKSFFSWHVEDVDLLSINYLHYGASKVWYAVPPGIHRARFEKLAQELFPKDAASCANFLRHKTVLITPALLRHHAMPVVTVKQDAGEFIVLNAGAYHAGFNQGFNCAEAVNFATEEWIPLGKDATRCDCKALGKDAVRVNMTVFPGCEESSSSEDDSSEEDNGMESVDSDEGSSNAAKTKPAPQKKRGVQKQQKRGPGRPRKHPSPSDPDKKKALQPRGGITKGGKGRGRQAKGGTRAAASEEGKPASGSGRQGAPKQQEAASATQVRPKKRKGADSADESAMKKAKLEPEAPMKKKPGRPRKQAVQEEAVPEDIPVTTTQAAGVKCEQDVPKVKAERPASAGTRGASGGHQGGAGGATAAMEALDEQVVGQPFVIVGKDDQSGKKYFYLVQELARPASGKGQVAVRWLEERPDGLWHPSTQTWDECRGSLCVVRTQPCRDKNGRRCFKLLTLRSSIEAVELED
ncbi:hypothetical protein WJX82_006712 [Trebouxia sp. C0006]